MKTGLLFCGFTFFWEALKDYSNRTESSTFPCLCSHLVRLVTKLECPWDRAPPDAQVISNTKERGELLNATYRTDKNIVLRLRSLPFPRGGGTAFFEIIDAITTEADVSSLHLPVHSQ